MKNLTEPGVTAKKLSRELQLLISIGGFLLLSVFYPFYMKKGYEELGSAKFRCYRFLVLLMAGLLLAVGIYAGINAWRVKKAGGQISGGKKISGKTPAGAEPSILYRMLAFGKAYPFWIGFSIVTLFSYLLSFDRKEALFGTDGWYLGIFSQMSFVFLATVMAFLPKVDIREKEEYYLLGMKCFCFISGIQYLWGVLNRFEIYPVHLTGEYNVFIASLGNINWYCGYWSVCFPLMTVLYLFEKRVSRRIALGMGSLLGFLIGILQGGSSAYPVLAVLLVFLGLVSVEDKSRILRFLELVCLFFLSVFLIRILGILLPGRMNYETNLLLEMTGTNRFLLPSLVGMAVCATLFFAGNRFLKREETEERLVCAVRIVVPILGVIAFFLFVLFMILNQKVEGGVWPVRYMSLFHFSADWGNQRGLIWIASYLGLKELKGIRLLLGVGPDCYSVFLYSFEAIAQLLQMQFGEVRLACAHNEALQMLICEGILGLICYAGIFVSYLYRSIRRLKCLFERKRRGSSDFYETDYVCLIAIMGATICYLVNNIVSFQQLLSTPFLFLLIGMGEGILRSERR